MEHIRSGCQLISAVSLEGRRLQVGGWWAISETLVVVVVVVRSLSSTTPMMDKSKAKARRRPPIPNMTILTVNGAKVKNGCLIKISIRMNVSSKSDAEYQCGGVGIKKSS